MPKIHLQHFMIFPGKLWKYFPREIYTDKI